MLCGKRGLATGLEREGVISVSMLALSESYRNDGSKQFYRWYNTGRLIEVKTVH